MEAHLFLEKDGGGDWTDSEVEDMMMGFIQHLSENGIMSGGSLGPMKTKEEQCNYCDGSGKKDFISEEKRCETCGGSGRKDGIEPKSDPEAEAEWNKIYAPIAQRTDPEHVLSIEHEETVTEHAEKRDDAEGNSQ